ncbi:ABC transporter substrate-binding protein [Oceanirhabdus sp. W0125-5]|uniref:ABC transporter substrate-binding protein n=1 Tax=Oceanirhabdus sp. W0125-5 TaxID=2999116 RepID=UPI0022F2F9D9|nr:ABC transporter substrate-binding protein [Oceanirhabdus sp. W0125-5]WBW95220.1 ABC transporter substrate-binding protein [Oceanirhabdus sp. W0125-5]
MKGRLSKITSFLLVLLMCISAFSGCGNSEKKENENVKTTQEETNNKDNKENEETPKTEASITGAENVSIEELSEFDPLDGVSAKGTDGKDATSNIEVTGEVNTLIPGEYELTYALKGTDLSVTRVVTVTSVDAALANGTYNYKFASAELRHTFMAAAEDYLLHSQHAGIPLFANAGFRLFSNRMQLVSETSLPVLGFGIDYSSMAADDSKILMEDGQKGNEGEYTFRESIGQNPAAWNQWKYDDGTTGDMMAYYYGTLYEYEFNEDKSGYVLNPSMASEDPIAIESRELPNGKIVSKKWQIKIKDGLEWKFNDKTDTSMITDTTINAVDFYETYKLALEEKWFRAVSGGSDFCTSSTKVVNGQEFVDGTAEWDTVGIKLIDDNTLQFEFVDEQSQWNVKYFLGSMVMTPVNIELYEALGDKYGIDEESIAYHGVYYVDYFESDKVIRMKKNDKFHDADKYFYTGRLITIIKDAEMEFQEFIAGKLDTVPLPSAHYEEYKSHPGLKRVPGRTTFRMMINGTGSKEGHAAQFPDSEWEPEPILANHDFKMGIFHAIDRKKLAEEVMKTSQTQMYLFTDAYVVEAETGMPYRNTPQGMAVGADLSPSTNGYNLDAARAYYDKALDTLIGEGVYKSGDEIKIEFNYFSGSETQALMATYIKDAMEEAFNSEKHNIKVTVDTLPKDFPGIYYDHMMVGEFDTSIGGIGGNTLDAASFLDTYCSDNRSGFTLNWGIDTSKPEITVSYKNDDGKMVKELWSFDAIVSALNFETEIVDGTEVPKEEGAEEEESEE